MRQLVAGSSRDLSNAFAPESVVQFARRGRGGGARGAHPGDRRGRLYRPRAVPRARRARPRRARAVPRAGGTDGRAAELASRDRRYRPRHRLVRASRPASTMVVHLANRAHRSPRSGGAERGTAGGARSWRAPRQKPECSRLRLYELGQGDGRRRPPRARRFAPPTRRVPRTPTAAASSRPSALCSTAARESGIELVILRPPLVYGPGVRANFRALMRLVGERAAAAACRGRQSPQPDLHRQSRRSRGAGLRCIPAPPGGCCWPAMRSICRHPQLIRAPCRRARQARPGSSLYRSPPWPRCADFPRSGRLVAADSLAAGR